MKKLLVVAAHPDDESFPTGGTIAKYAQAGWMVDLVTATCGEAGSTGPYGTLAPEKLGKVRQRELEDAAKILGISSVTFLDYIDGTLKSLPAGDPEDKIFRELVRRIPNVVITYEPGGISNHPDHIRLTNATTFSFQKYASLIDDLYSDTLTKSKTVFPELLARVEVGDRLEPKLYFVCIPESIGAHLQSIKAFPPISFGKPWSTIPDKKITTVVEVTKFAAKKRRALLAHETQKSDVERFLRIPNNPFLSQEHYVLRMQGTHEVFMGKTDAVSNRL